MRRFLSVILVSSLCWGQVLCAAPIEGPKPPGVEDYQQADETPELGIGLAFPLTKNRNGRVVTSTDVMLNPGTVLKKGTEVLLIFEMPMRGDKDVKLADPHAKLKKALVKTQQDVQVAERDPLVEAAYARAEKDVWNDPLLFGAALENLKRDRLRFVYLDHETGLREIRTFELIEGMLLGMSQGKVTALYLDLYSDADKAGVRQWDHILTVNDKTFNGLEEFLILFNAEKQAAKMTTRKVTLGVESQKTGEKRTVEFRLPLSLKTSFWEEI